MTRDFNNLSLLRKLLALLLQILFNLAIAKAVRMRISAEQVPRLHRVVLRYLKLVTSSNLWPFVLLVMILLFSVLTSIPDSAALSVSQLVMS